MADTGRGGGFRHRVSRRPIRLRHPHPSLERLAEEYKPAETFGLTSRRICIVPCYPRCILDGSGRSKYRSMGDHSDGDDHPCTIGSGDGGRVGLEQAH